MRAKLAVGAAVALAIGVAGCGQDQSGSQQHGTPSIVASTDVWGSVASAVTGDHAAVKSIVTSAADDPHSFEVTPSDAAAITDASLVVYNGGGYDRWVDDVLSSHQGAPAVNAYSLLPAGLPQPANEHVFYDLETAKAVANQIAEKLAQSDSAHADDYKANAATFGEEADTIAASERAIGAGHPGASVVATEPVAHYLLLNAGITDKTPPGFASAVEEGDDPSPADVAAVLDLISTHQVSALVVNKQTETPVTKRITDAARQASVPIVEVTETLPEGQNYLDWQRKTVDELARQLDAAAQANR
ncbi:metal ABC transporter solute-binding protein, Zn/Mn family [Mycobacterium sp.]|uniref:metal ABC transporter solute-binding protein, Zn/Mn family n=1 Tax=Mycobacterium sp. TaxID=1785 RepID=UPI002C772F28|nr:zinc ABC transporter substrate-binding protein [Mycobacterium sp.]HKP43828.1 zinc ABC transporter substrate-binding protein [Mycobacterium sp.]